MDKQSKAPNPQEIQAFFEAITTQISVLEDKVAIASDFFDFLPDEKKNFLHQEFERLCQNINTLTSWLNFSTPHRASFKMPSVNLLLAQDKESITLKFLVKPENQS